MKVIVVGAGLSGLSLASMLRRLNIDCTILEANPQLHSHYQAPITLWCNALSCFRAFGMDHFVDGVAAPEEFAGIRSARDGRWLLRIPNLPVILQPMTSEETVPSTCAPKAADSSLVSQVVTDAYKQDLATVPLRATYSMKFVRNMLKRHCPDIRFGKRVVDLLPMNDSDTRGGVGVVCADGEIIKGDVVVGADGMHSTVRRLVYPEESIAHSCRTLNMTQVDGYVNVEKASPRFGVSPCEIWGHRRTINYYPLFHEGQQRIAFTATLFDSPSDITYDFESMTLEEVRNMYRGVLSKEFAEFGDDMAELFRNATVAVPVEALEVPIMPQWHNRRAVLMGDAAHGAFPSFLSQDASLCVEDAAILATALAEVYERQSDLIAHAFTNYEIARRARIEKYIRQSRRARRFTMWNQSKTRDTLLRCTPWWAATLGHRWLNDWSYRASHLVYEPEAEYRRYEK